MKSKISFLIAFALLLTASLGSNPIIPRFIIINEIIVNSSHNWSIELYNESDFAISLDSYYLASNTDTCCFPEDSKIGSGQYLEIYPFYLDSLFSINPDSDLIEIIFPFPVSGGALSIENMIPGQSLCWSGDFYYRDNTPTLGIPNDTLNATGEISGIVTDTTGAPVEGATIQTEYQNVYPVWTVKTDNSGYFSGNTMATRVFLYVQKESYDPVYTSVSVYPESTVFLNIEMDGPSTSVSKKDEPMKSEYQLNQNFPNPFNSSTFISYRLPKDDIVDVSVFDINGRLVETLHSGFQTRGNYKLMWNAFAAPSSVYIIRLRSAGVILHRKCVLLK